MTLYQKMVISKHLLVWFGLLISGLLLQLSWAEEALENSMFEDVSELPLERHRRSINFASVQSKLRNVLGTNDFPDELAKVVGALDSALNILKCLPLKKSGNCYRPNDYCDVEANGYTLRVKLTICKDPAWSIRIDFQLPKEIKRKIPGIIRPLTFISVSPIVLTLNHNKPDGVTTLVSNSRIATGGLKLFGLRFNAVKAYFKFDLFVRWDCTRPGLTSKRLEYNTAYDDGRPGNDMNKLYYKLKIGYEIKTKRFPCFCYKCKKCADILNKQGHFAEGPESCKSDWSNWKPRTCSFVKRCEPESMSRRRTCIGQSTGGPPCQGSASSSCGSIRGKRRAWEFRNRRMCN